MISSMTSMRRSRRFSWWMRYVALEARHRRGAAVCKRTGDGKRGGHHGGSHSPGIRLRLVPRCLNRDCAATIHLQARFRPDMTPSAYRSDARSDQVLSPQLVLEVRIVHWGGDEARNPKNSIHHEHRDKKFPCAGADLSTHHSRVDEVLELVDNNQEPKRGQGQKGRHAQAQHHNYGIRDKVANDREEPRYERDCNHGLCERQRGADPGHNGEQINASQRSIRALSV